MSNIRIIYNNIWRKAAFTSHGTEHPQFPWEDTQADTPSQFWRSRYGNNSGGGSFLVNTTNHKINFNETGPELTATLSAGNYTGQTLANEVKAQLEAAGAWDYTVSYNDTAALFTIAANANFDLYWKMGSNYANMAANLLGYANNNDDTGNNNYTGDYRRIHSQEWGRIDTVTAQEINFITLLNHDISANGIVWIESSNNSNMAGATYDNISPINTGNHFAFLSPSRTAQYFQLSIYDATNPNSYIQIGPVILGKYWQPNYTFAKEYTQGRADDSLVDESHALVEYAQARPTRRTWNLPFPLGLTQTDADKIVDFFDEVGLKHGFVVCFDSNSANTTSHFVKNIDLNDPVYRYVNSWQWQLNIREKL